MLDLNTSGSELPGDFKIVSMLGIAYVCIRFVYINSCKLLWPITVVVY